MLELSAAGDCELIGSRGGKEALNGFVGSFLFDEKFASLVALASLLVFRIGLGDGGRTAGELTR